jgi:hypothetical protein
VNLHTVALAACGAFSCVALSVPLASADPEPAPAPVDYCNASTLAQTVSSVTASLSDYFAAAISAGPLIPSIRAPIQPE